MDRGGMMAERPAAAAAPAGGGGAGVSIGNYKGVMLCNRPFAGTGGGHGGAAKPKTGMDRPPLIAGRVSSPPGLLKAKAEPKLLPDRSKKDSALSKHKKWLSQLQKQKNDIQSAVEEEENEALERRAAFANREKEKRAAIRGETGYEGRDARKSGGGSGGEAKEADEGAAGGPEVDAPEPLPPRADVPAFTEAQQRKLAKKASAKPKWALTEDGAEQAEEEEIDELMEFANGLDFDAYVDDMEVRAALESVRRRVDELDTARIEELAAEKDAEDAAAEGGEEKSGDGLAPLRERPPVPRMRNVPKLGEGGEGAFEEEEEERSEMATARGLLAEHKALGRIHSARSIAEIAKRQGVGKMAPVVMPTVVEHKDDGGARLKKDDPSRLPYMNRNPAV